MLLVLFFVTNATARTPDEIDAVVHDEMGRQHIVGLALAIVRSGELYYARGYGHHDLARTKPVDTNTVFRWGSISKTLTAVAALKLAEENPAFSLDDRVTEHVDYWPSHGPKGEIRVRQLLSHRSGIIHYRNHKHCPGNRTPDYDRFRHRDADFNARQAVEVFTEQPLCFSPGTGYKYSTFGYSLLGAAIEGGSGIPYADWVKKSIQSPLGMDTLRQARDERRGFNMRDGRMIPVTEGNAAWKLPGGGWESGILDLARFANALVQESLLKRTDRLWTKVPGNLQYGYGVMLAHDGRVAGHEGKQRVSRALLVMFPESEDRLGIALMTNSAHSRPGRIARRLADLFSDRQARTVNR